MEGGRTCGLDWIGLDFKFFLIFFRSGDLRGMREKMNGVVVDG